MINFFLTSTLDGICFFETRLNSSSKNPFDDYDYTDYIYHLIFLRVNFWGRWFRQKLLQKAGHLQDWITIIANGLVVCLRMVVCWNKFSYACWIFFLVLPCLLQEEKLQICCFWYSSSLRFFRVCQRTSYVSQLKCSFCVTFFGDGIMASKKVFGVLSGVGCTDLKNQVSEAVLLCRF